MEDYIYECDICNKEFTIFEINWGEIREQNICIYCEDKHGPIEDEKEK